MLSRLRDRLSPEQICGELERKAARKVLHYETIYRYIYPYQPINKSQCAEHETLIQYLRIRHRKRYKKWDKPVRRALIPDRISIDQRPAVVKANSELGHWEADGHWERPPGRTPDIGGTTHQVCSAGQVTRYTCLCISHGSDQIFTPNGAARAVIYPSKQSLLIMESSLPAMS